MSRYILLRAFFFGLLELGMLFSFWPVTALSASYDYYVKEGGNGNGSKDDPFGTIDEAIAAIGSSEGKKVFIDKGTYATSFTVPEETVLVGTDAKDVTITGTITLEDDVKLEKIGFSGGGNILVKKNAHVTLEKLRFKNLSGIGTGIKTEPGSAKVVIRDSVLDAAKKGMYLQAGTTVEAERLEVINSAEEGIDIRENVNGSITQGTFRNNKESGIEIILGSSNFTIRDSTFLSNGASGIAAQFFSGAKKTGNVRIEGNTFSKNDNYGVDCKAPQDGPDSKFYYLNSLNIVNNAYKDNREGDIGKRCKIMTDEERIALEKEEAEKKALIEERTANLSLSEVALAERLVKSIEIRKMRVEKFSELEHERIKPTLERLDALEKEGSTRLETLTESRSTWRCYLRGTKLIDAELTLGESEIGMLLARLENELSTLQYESNQKLAQAKLETLRSLQETLTKAKAAPACRFSLFGWAINFWNKGGVVSMFDIPPALTFLNPNTDQRLLFLGTLSYYPKVREVAVRFGDERLVTGLLEKSAEYREVIGDLRLPLGNEADPLPPVGTTTELAFPVRFSNYFASAHINTLHLSNTAQINANSAPYHKTVTNLSYAGIQTLGSIPGEGKDTVTGETHRTTWLSEKKLHWVAYRETSGTLATVRETIMPFKEKNEPVVVVIAWDEKQGKVMGPKREELLQEIVKAGASLIIGTGLVIPYEQKTMENIPVYTSLGSAFEKFQTGDTSKKSVALEMSIEPDGKLKVTDKNLVFTTEKGLELRP